MDTKGVPRRRTQSQARGLVIGVVAVVLGFGALWLISYLASEGTIEPKLGDDEFTYDAEELAEEIADRGPFLLADASANRQRDVYVQHLGDDPEEGWLAFDARAPDQDDRDCSLRWTGDQFEDPCTGRTFPPDGDGLEQYDVRVDEGTVHVRFRPEEDE